MMKPVVLALALMVAAATAAAQDPPPGPYEAKLDGQLAAHDFGGVAQAIVGAHDEDSVGRGLNWLKDQQLNRGAGSQITFLYAASLWRVSRGLPEPYHTGLGQSAGVQLLLVRWMLATEGFQCVDATAPHDRLVAIEGQLQPVDQFVTALSEADLKPMKDLALKALLVTFPRRANDIWLCQGGIAQYGKYFDKHPEIGQKSVEELGGKTVPGTVGKTVVLNDPSIMPDFAPYADWKSKRHAALDRITDSLGRARLTGYSDDRHRMK